MTGPGRSGSQAGSAAVALVEVDGIDEISWWIMGYGAEVEVLAPAALRQRLAQTAARIVEQYSA